MEGVKDDCRDAGRWAWVESTAQDIRFAARLLRQSPAFTIAAIGTLALGIGANTAIFQLLDAVRLRSLPVPNPQSLARIEIQGSNGGFGVSNDRYDLTYPLWDEIRRQQKSFSNVFAWAGDYLPIGEDAQARRARGLWVSGEYFSALGVPPALGRLFDREDDKPGCAASSVVLSHGFWQSEFGGRQSAIGSRFVVLDRPFHVIGVTPPAFTGLTVGRAFDFALPLCTADTLGQGRSSSRRDYFWLTVMGRLRPDMPLALASAEVQADSGGWFGATVPSGYSEKSLEQYRKFRLEAIPAGNGVSWLRNQYNTSLWLLLGITGLVLLIACANLANLMLARASAREREYAVRLALGAPRSRLILQSLAESILLALSGATLGLTLAQVLSRAIVRFLGRDGETVRLDLSTDWRMLAFTAAVAFCACVVFGLAPALRSSRAEPGAAMKSGGRGSTAGRERFSFQRLLVIGQISISLALVVAALLFVRSFRNLMTVDPGFREKGILLAFVDFSRLKLPNAAIKPFQRELLALVRAIPQVEAAATTTNTLLNGSSWSLGFHMGTLEGSSKFTWVSPGYFETMQTPVLTGREFNANDSETSPHVALVNQTFVQRYLGGANPIGKTLRTTQEPGYPETQYEIIGITRDTKYSDLREKTPPMAYAPMSQVPIDGPFAAICVRSSAPLSDVSRAIERRTAELHPGVRMEFRVFDKEIQEGLIRERLMAALSGFFGALAALLATIGLYGVIAYIVVRRRNEIGIRMALGASRGRVVGLVMREATFLLAAGIVIGVAGSFALTKAAASLLFGLSAHDPVTFLAAAGLLAIAAALGSYLPARRASRLDPMDALRCD